MSNLILFSEEGLFKLTPFPSLVIWNIEGIIVGPCYPFIVYNAAFLRVHGNEIDPREVLCHYSITFHKTEAYDGELTQSQCLHERIT